MGVHRSAAVCDDNLKAALRSRYKNENGGTPSYVNNGLMIHNFECDTTQTGVSCYGVDYNLQDQSLKWNPDCLGAQPNTSEVSIFCPTRFDWVPQKQAVSFSYIRNDLGQQGIWTSGDYIDVGYILGGNTLTAKGHIPRCAFSGDANTNARKGGGCGSLVGGGWKTTTIEDPGAIYAESCQETVLKGADRSQWRSLFGTGACSIITNINAGAGSSDPRVKQYINDLNQETTNPFDDMFANFTSCAPNCAVGLSDNEILIPCCQSIEATQPDAQSVSGNWQKLADMDVMAIHYVMGRQNDKIPIPTKKAAAKRFSELLAQATGKPAVPVVGIDYNLLVNHKADDDNLFVCDATAQASEYAGSVNLLV